VGNIDLVIRRASVSDAAALTQLMHTSSAYKGDYARILEGYGVTSEQIAEDLVYLAERAGQLVGFYSLIPGASPELDLMFVADTAQGTGLGLQLFEHMKAKAAELGITNVKIVSHPPAVGFYQRMGAVRVGMKSRSAKITWDRPILDFPIGKSHD
jgi:N-acetylglutamate synthase-like GNAT family acetyltransferase